MRNYKLIQEIEQHRLESSKITTDVKSLLDKKELPFNNIFGDKVRIAEPLAGGKEYADNLQAVTAGYNLDFPSWTGVKEKDINKKNPIKIGKILFNKKREYETHLKDNPDLPQSHVDTVMRRIEAIDKYLKIPDLKKQYDNATKTQYTVIYSRAPVDVLRMGDFNWTSRSCHAPGGQYYYCAIADAMLNAGVVYLITNDDFDKIKDHLQDDEIFSDSDRDVDGIQPLARMRIRCIIDSDGNTVAVPVTKIYGKSGYSVNNDLQQQFIRWAKKQDVTEFNWDDTLTLKGGSYEDYGYEISNIVEKLWNKDVSYNTENNEELDSEHHRERCLDQIYEFVGNYAISEKLDLLAERYFFVKRLSMSEGDRDNINFAPVVKLVIPKTYMQKNFHNITVDRLYDKRKYHFTLETDYSPDVAMLRITIPATRVDRYILDEEDETIDEDILIQHITDQVNEVLYTIMRGKNNTIDYAYQSDVYENEDYWALPLLNSLTFIESLRTDKDSDESLVDSGILSDFITNNKENRLVLLKMFDIDKKIGESKSLILVREFIKEYKYSRERGEGEMLSQFTLGLQALARKIIPSYTLPINMDVNFARTVDMSNDEHIPSYFYSIKSNSSNTMTYRPISYNAPDYLKIDVTASWENVFAVLIHMAQKGNYKMLNQFLDIFSYDEDEHVTELIIQLFKNIDITEKDQMTFNDVVDYVM